MQGTTLVDAGFHVLLGVSLQELSACADRMQRLCTHAKEFVLILDLVRRQSISDKAR